MSMNAFTTEERNFLNDYKELVKLHGMALDISDGALGMANMFGIPSLFTVVPINEDKEGGKVEDYYEYLDKSIEAYNAVKENEDYEEEL